MGPVTYYVLTRIDLPNGRHYAFEYHTDDTDPNNPTYGELTKITLPTGGYIRYEYVRLESFDRPPDPGDGCWLESLRVWKRIVSDDGTAGSEKTWTYEYELSGNLLADLNDYPYDLTYTTTVTDPAGNKTVHTFDGRGVHETNTKILIERLCDGCCPPFSSNHGESLFAPKGNPKWVE